MENPKSSSPSCFRFDDVLIDRHNFRVLKSDQPKTLAPRAFDLLLYLVEHRGRVVEKQELFDQVWQGAHVTDNALTQEIKEIRRALGDDAEAPRYIETVPRRGYRLLANVQEVNGESEETNGPESAASRDAIEAVHAAQSPAGEFHHRQRSTTLALAALVVVFGGIVFGLYKFISQHRSQTERSEAALKITPETSSQGFEVQPALSPDGNYVAFVWDQEKGDRGDIYVKQTGAGTPLQLTKGPANDTNPAWSPDGRHIAFLRLTAGSTGSHSNPYYSSPPTGSSGLFIVPALGGPEVKLAEAYPKGDCRSLDWSPDGKFLAVTDKSLRQGPFSADSSQDPFSIFLVSQETGKRRRLTSPPAGTIGDGGLGFSPDGKMVAFIRSVGVGIDDIYLMSVEGGEPRRLTSDNLWIHGLAWTRDGRELVFSSNRGRTFGLWSVPVSGGAPRPFVTVGQNVSHPSASRGRDHLVYVQESFDSNIWRVEVSSATGRGLAPTQLISSTQIENSPQYSPDGRKIAFSSEQSGSFEIWVCNSDGSAPVRLTNFGGPGTGTPRWSPDGSRIAFGSTAAGQTDIYVVSAEGGPSRRLTEDPSEDVRPSWSRDGQWIYFGSNRGGDWQVWKMPADGGQATPVTKQGGREAIESPDGKFVYYAKSSGGSWGIWRTPVAGGEEVRILDQVPQGNWGLSDKGIYFVNPQAKPGPAIQFFSFATGQVTQVAMIEKRLIQGPPAFAVSPDGHWILYAQLDQSNSDIMLVENFR